MEQNVKRDYLAVSLALASGIIGALIMRVVIYVLPIGSDSYGESLLSDAIFSLTTQLIFFLIIPFLSFKFLGKRSVKEVLEFSSAGKFKPYYLIALPIGMLAFFVTVTVSSLWIAILQSTGYNAAVSVPEKPEIFNAGYFIADILLTAVLPAICEEFLMRGGTLTTAKTTLKPVGCMVFCGICFGLFHQNIKQVLYTALFGAFAAFLTLKLKSIYPAMLMHFGSNFMSVFIDYATDYNWAVGGGFYDFFSSVPIILLILIDVAIVGAIIGLTYLMLYLREKKVISDKMEVIKDSAFDVTNKRVVLMGEFDPERISQLEMEREVYGDGYEEKKYKPSLRDMMIIISLGVVSVLTTVFSYVWGFFY